MKNTQTEATSSQMALMDSPRCSATVPRQKAPTSATRAHPSRGARRRDGELMEGDSRAGSRSRSATSFAGNAARREVRGVLSGGGVLASPHSWREWPRYCPRVSGRFGRGGPEVRCDDAGELGHPAVFALDEEGVE